MASMAIFTNTATRLEATNRLALILRKPWSSRFSAFASPRPSQGSRGHGRSMATYNDAANQGCDAVKKGAEAAKKGSQQLKKDASAAARDASEKAEEVAGKAKHGAENAWESVKETSQKIKDTVVEKAEATTQTVKRAINEAAAEAERRTKK